MYGIVSLCQQQVYSGYSSIRHDVHSSLVMHPFQVFRFVCESLGPHPVAEEGSYSQKLPELPCLREPPAAFF